MTPEERSRGALPPEEILTASADFGSKLIANWVAQHGKNPFEGIGVHCQPGNHLLLGPQELDDLVRWLRTLTGGNSFAVITVSAVMREDRLQQALETLQIASARYGQRLHFGLVIDWENLQRPGFKQTYWRNVEHIRNAFEYVEPVVNIGPGIERQISPAGMHDFILDHRFPDVDMNLYPVLDTAEGFSVFWARIVDWLREYHALWPMDKYEVNWGTTLSWLMDETAELDWRDMPAFLTDRLVEELHVSAAGEVYFMQGGGIGNFVPLGHRSGFKPLFSLAEIQGRSQQEVTHILGAQAKVQAVRILSKFSRHPACAGCAHNKVCAAGGFIQMQQVMAPHLADSRACPAGIRPLLDDIAERRPERERAFPSNPDNRRKH